jgi:hypothetical protein
LRKALSTQPKQIKAYLVKKRKRRRKILTGFPQRRLIFSPDLDFLRGALVILTGC